MSSSQISFDVDGYDFNFKSISEEIDDLFGHYSDVASKDSDPKINIFTVHSLFNQGDHEKYCIQQIIIFGWAAKVTGDFGTRMVVSYHHAKDPTYFEVILEVGNLLKEKEINIQEYF